ncbi:MAG: DUF2752 domain-containing protein [Cyclobacteriaceae bacterium]|nr:DUF2752 domain-containing protein [Cyclobacteriaceae bacterium]
MHKVYTIISKNKELSFWSISLIALWISYYQGSSHFTLCPLANIGLEICPGCGVGRSIGLLLHGEVRQSFFYHPLGIPALFILIYRIYRLFKLNFSTHG